MLTITESVHLLDAFVRYAYNVELDEFKKLFPEASASYLSEKYKLMQENLGAFFGQLDSVHRALLIQLIADRYDRREGIEIQLPSDSTP